MAKKTYAVLGATGNVGKVVAESIKARGYEVREIARKKGVNIDDVVSLARAFWGADGAFLMIPPDYRAPDLRKRQNEIGTKIAEALKKSSIKRIVFLSSVYAQYEEGSGPILGLRDMEQRLNELQIAQLVHLRPAYFMENHLRAIPQIKQSNMYVSAFRFDVAFPMIAVRDISRKVAEMLTEEPFNQPPVVELLGPCNYMMHDVTRILGAAIGKTYLKYTEIPYDELHKTMQKTGMSTSYADALIELTRGINELKLRPSEERSERNTTATTIEQFAQDTFRNAYQSTTLASR